MTAFNTALGLLFNAALYPFRGLHSIVGLTLVSLLTAVVMLLVFKKTSNQQKLALVKRRIHACLFEIRLFSDDLRAIFSAQFEILRHNLSYLGLTLVPMLVMIVPLVLVVIQLQFHYGYRAPVSGSWALFKVQLSEDWESHKGVADPTKAGRPLAALTVPRGLTVETAPVWIPSQRELDWRIAVNALDNHELRLQLGGETYTKSLQASAGVVRRSPVRVAAGFVDQLLYPVEKPLPADGPVVSISVRYPGQEDNLAPWLPTWMLTYFVLSIVFAFLLKGRFGVTI